MDFGEIVEASTRAFWDDYDEEYNEGGQSLQWKWLNDIDQSEKLGTIKQFVVLEGNDIHNFANATVLNGTLPLCNLEKQKIKVYHLVEQDLAICLSEERDMNTFSSITELLTPLFKSATQFNTISFQSSVTHKDTINGDDSEKQLFFKGINSKIDSIEELEEPNLLTGVAAGVASWCHHSNLSFSSYICYMDRPEIDSFLSIPIIKLIRNIGIRCNVEKYDYKVVDSSLYT